jgi:HAMP domain-containing protein
MGLKAKFNLVMFGTFLAGLALAAVLSWNNVQNNARKEVVQEANVMLSEALAIREYTVREIRPLLADQVSVRFLPHTVPSWAAQTNMRALAARFPDYSYKEAALDPTNPADRATDWENAIIDDFARNPSLTTLTTTRDTAAGPILSISHPIRIVDKDCLACHSTPAAAPATMIDLYGNANGFGWKLGDVVGAQIVSVPMQVALDRGNETFKVYLAALAGVFAITIVFLNLLLHFVIVKPIRRMSAIASEISLGDVDAPEFNERGHDEIASLAGSFNRMRRSLANAMTLLEA